MVNTSNTTDEPKTAQIILTITPTDKGYELRSMVEGSYFPLGMGQAFYLKAVRDALANEANMMLSQSGSALVKATADIANEIKNGQPSGETKDCPEANGQKDN